MYPRAVTATLLVAAVSLFSTFRLFMQTADAYTQAPAIDGVTEYTERLKALKDALPPTGVIGYMTDPGTPANNTDAMAEHHIIQYALAPLVVVPNANQKYVVGNFHKTIATGSLRDQGFKLVREFGNGIALLENEKVK
ncbi:MAG: hypothetical protein FJW38_02395 [Acidobacteria bacterium]|nr:hypothetical protein [Acidobacteriota bacterium]